MRYLITVSFFTLSACAQAQEAVPPKPSSNCLVAGQWVNDRGSAVTLSCDGDKLSGVYNTNVGEPDKGQSFSLRGWAEGDNLSFTVNFKGYGSITAWVGQIEGEEMKTLWHLTRDIDDADEPDDMWKSVTSGASVFTRAATPH